MTPPCPRKEPSQLPGLIRVSFCQYVLKSFNLLLRSWLFSIERYASQRQDYVEMFHLMPPSCGLMRFM